MTNSQLSNEIQQIKSLLQEQQPRPMTVDEAAKYLSISKSRLYVLTSQALIPHFKPTGKKIYFRKEDCDAFMLRNRITPREEIAAELEAAR
jgi:excisionase family DNA binding protein